MTWLLIEHIALTAAILGGGLFVVGLVWAILANDGSAWADLLVSLSGVFFVLAVVLGLVILGHLIWS